jgi:hypothetical protein
VSTGKVAVGLRGSPPPGTLLTASITAPIGKEGALRSEVGWQTAGACDHLRSLNDKEAP